MAKVVFCDDSESVRKLIKFAMRGTGHDVAIAEDGEAGLRLLRSSRPDLLVTDLAMPGLNGLELHDAVRADPELHDLPIVFLTASNHSLLGEASERAPLAILAKPFSPHELLLRLEELMAGRPPRGPR